MTVIDPNAFLEELKTASASSKEQEADEIGDMIEYLEASSQKPLALIEKFPVYYYEEGTGGFNRSLQQLV